MRVHLLTICCSTLFAMSVYAQERPRELGITIGLMPTGPQNAITDVPGLKVGQVTLIEGENIRTGATAVVPHDGNIFQNKVPAAVYVGNGFGKLAGSTQVEELGNIETPIVLTNTLSVAAGIEGLVEYTLQQSGNEEVRSVNAVVGENNDGYLNDIRGRHVRPKHILEALQNATDTVAEGNVGAGTGTRCFGFKGGIGTASRQLPASFGGYTLGVLVQTNFGGALTINGYPVGKSLEQYYFRDQLQDGADGSCMIVVATDAPLDARNLKRLAKRALLGLGRTGGIASNGSGDYVIAFSTTEALQIPYSSDAPLQTTTVLSNNSMTPLFMAVIEATEEAIINSLFAAETMRGNGRKVEELPVDKVLEWLKEKE